MIDVKSAPSAFSAGQQRDLPAWKFGSLKVMSPVNRPTKTFGPVGDKVEAAGHGCGVACGVEDRHRQIAIQVVSERAFELVVWP
jgi:hypothetical protein